MTLTSPTDPLFLLRQVTKSYSASHRRHAVLENLDLTIEKNAFLALMGPSGSGKSTLLNLLAGIDQPDRGEILFSGKRINDQAQSYVTQWRARHIGFVFQHYNLLPMLSSARNVEMPLLLTPLGRSARRDRVEAALELVGLTAAKAKLPSQMSGGEQQRVAIARAIVTDVSTLLCDEPTGNLDSDSSTGVLEILQQLNAEFGKTIVMVTHDPRAAGYAKKVLTLNKGVLTDRVSPQ